MKILLVVFLEKISFGVIWSFQFIFYFFIGSGQNWVVTVGSLNSQDMISFIITTVCLNPYGMIRIFKQSGHDFSSKRLFDRYCMDIMLCLCMEVNIQQKVVWFYEKASLRICYVSFFFECKGPWMLKTDSLII